MAQQRLVLEQTRDQTRANTVTAWGQLVAGKAQVASAQSQVTASEIALNGVREEAKAGQRTTLDVLNAQQALVNARVALVTAQHDRVVASYAVLSRRWDGCRRRCSTSQPRSTIRACITSRCATAGLAFARPTAADRNRRRLLREHLKCRSNSIGISVVILDGWAGRLLAANCRGRARLFRQAAEAIGPARTHSVTADTRAPCLQSFVALT